MTYPAHDLFVMGGGLGTGADAEIWQCNIRGTFVDPPTDPGRTAWLTGVGGALKTWFTSNDAYMRNDASLLYVKCNQIQASGAYVNVGTFTYDVPQPAKGAVVSSFPDFVTLCWSWTTEASRGPASKGRIYPPNVPTAASQGSARVSAANAQAHAQAGNALLSILNTEYSGVSFRPQVVSKVGVGSKRDIVATRVGDVMDVQRRRKNALRETYYLAP